MSSTDTATSGKGQTSDHFNAYKQVMTGQSPSHAIDSDKKHQPQDGGSGPTSDEPRTVQDITDIQEDGNTVDVIKTSSATKNAHKKRGRFNDSLLVRRIENWRAGGLHRSMQLEISGYLKDQFKQLRLAQNLTTIATYDDPITIPEPFMVIYWCRKSIREEKLHLLQSFLTDYMSDRIDDIKNHKKACEIRFDVLWAIFPPNEPIVIQNPSVTVPYFSESSPSGPITWCARVKEFHYRKTQQGNYWGVVFTHSAWNGENFGHGENFLEFPQFTGVVKIRTLPICPVQFFPDRGNLKKAAKIHDERYRRYCMDSDADDNSGPRGSPMVYDGPFWTRRKPEERKHPLHGCRIIDSPSSKIKGEVVVDFEAFFSHAPEFRTTLVDTEEDSEKYAEKYAEKKFSMYPPLVPAYSFSCRTWGFVFIGGLTNVEMDPNALDQFQSEHKPAMEKIIHGLHESDRHFKDLVKGKGQGLVFLLEGDPGCGKTLAAECVSRKLGKALYHLSGGELGTSIESVQDSLEKAFEYSARWDTILLLDEAETFMAKRDGSSIERNSLVAVFLRLLEYQSGIVFLTTNRLMDIDSAFMSRIHLTLTFKALNKNNRKKIWNQLLERNGGTGKIRQENIDELSHKPYNGREIKNVLRLARLFSQGREGEGTPSELTFEDIKGVLPMVPALQNRPLRERVHVKSGGGQPIERSS